MTYREISIKLQKMGCLEIPRRGGGSHRKWLNPNLNRGAVLPDHGPKDLKIGTVKVFIKQLGLDWEIFVRS